MQSRSGWSAAKGCLEVRGVCLPLGHGTSCATWAVVEPECSVASPPAWCASEWCYVNASACWQPKARSPSVPEFHYSYAACGYLDDYSESKHARVLLGRSIRVSYPADSASGFTLVTRGGKKRGSFPTFMQGIFDRFNMTVEVVPVSEQSKERSPESIYTACVHEVALNRTDLCIGDFWSTSQRRLMAAFTSELYQDLFYVVAPITEENGLLEVMASPFRPFVPSVWLGIAGMTVVASLGMYVLERGKMFKEATCSRGVSRSLYFGFQSMVGASSSYEAKTLGGRILNLAFGFFIMIVIASYTANLASFLVAKASSSKIDSIEGGIKAGMKFCGVSQVQESLVSMEPQLRNLYMPVRNDVEALTSLDKGICQLAILAKQNFENAQRRRGMDTHCNKVAVGQALIAIGNAMPIRSDLQAPMSWAMTVQKSSGAYDVAAALAKRTYLEPNSCDAQRGKKAKEGMEFPEMTGVFIIAVAGIALGFFANFLRYESRWAERRLSRTASVTGEAQPAELAEPEERPSLKVTVFGQKGSAPRVVVRYLDAGGDAERNSPSLPPMAAV